MRLNPHARAFGLTLWCLLLLWMFFGALVMAEELQVITETAAEDQEDLDEEALSYGFGLKSTVLPLQIPSFAFSATVSESLLSVFIAPAFTPLELHDPPSRPLYQRLSVYRI